MAGIPSNVRKACPYGPSPKCTATTDLGHLELGFDREAPFICGKCDQIYIAILYDTIKVDQIRS
jgi:hypothetical protein